MEIERCLLPNELSEEYKSGVRLFKNVEMTEGSIAKDFSLSGASFEDCWFHSCSFLNIDLSQTKFEGCNLKCVTIENCNLSDSSWNDCAVCSMSIESSTQSNMLVTKLDAYGFPIQNLDELMEFARPNKDTNS